MKPKYIYSCSSISRKRLKYSRGHPCRDLQVLWFGTRVSDAKEDEHDWYGNVEFALPADFLLKRWKNCYFVEMLSAPTHTVTRLLITNTDYSAVLPQYDPRGQGEQWVATPEGHLVLFDCLRYNNEGYNKHGHKLEFMIEVTPYGQKKILDECEISFRNHSKARHKDHPHVCYRYKNTDELCPWPVSTSLGSRIFFYEHRQRWLYSSCLATPRLSSSAEHFRQCYLTMDAAPLVPGRSFPPAPGQSTPPFPLYTTNFHSTKFVLHSVFGLFSSRSFLEISGFTNGPEHVRHLRNWQFMPWNVLLGHLWNQYLRERTDNGESQPQSPGLDDSDHNSQVSQPTLG